MVESKSIEWKEEMEGKIAEAFSLFDRDNANAVVQEDVGNIMRALEVFPSESVLLKDYLPVLKDDDNGGYVPYKNFEALMLRILVNKESERSSAETVMQAFRAIDVGSTGMISSELLEELLVTKGTAFRPNEVEQFLEAAKDPETGNIYYEDYVELLFNK